MARGKLSLKPPSMIAVNLSIPSRIFSHPGSSGITSAAEFIASMHCQTPAQAFCSSRRTPPPPPPPPGTHDAVGDSAPAGVARPRGEHRVDGVPHVDALLAADAGGGPLRRRDGHGGGVPRHRGGAEPRAPIPPGLPRLRRQDGLRRPHGPQDAEGQDVRPGRPRGRRRGADGDGGRAGAAGQVGGVRVHQGVPQGGQRGGPAGAGGGGLGGGPDHEHH
mmetsp:Transcript_12283/g.30820  ORF Transcript_12283/g.30820 Transcript_12283/m.30820 type:complete len:219 (-) Transcript_12283:120-776(-)